MSICCHNKMEAAAIAWVCQQFSIPFVGIKSITDIVDNEDNIESVNQFEQNLSKASDTLQEKLTLILELMANEPLNKWSM